MEKRLFNRINVNNGICTLRKDDNYSGVIKNISLCGLFVKTDMSLTAKQRINIDITLPEDTGGIVINTEVVATRVENDGIAFKFDTLINQKEFWVLQSFIYPWTRI